MSDRYTYEGKVYVTLTDYAREHNLSAGRLRRYGKKGTIDGPVEIMGRWFMPVDAEVSLPDVQRTTHNGLRMVAYIPEEELAEFKALCDEHEWEYVNPRARRAARRAAKKEEEEDDNNN